jgi:hypothetical protein
MLTCFVLRLNSFRKYKNQRHDFQKSGISIQIIRDTLFFGGTVLPNITWGGRELANVLGDIYVPPRKRRDGIT